MVVAVHDITHRKESEVLLAEKSKELEDLDTLLGGTNTALVESRDKAELSKEYFRLLLSNIPGAVYGCETKKAWELNFINNGMELITATVLQS